MTTLDFIQLVAFALVAFFAVFCGVELGNPIDGRPFVPVIGFVGSIAVFVSTTHYWTLILTGHL